MKMKKKLISMLLVSGFALTTMTGCIRPYDTPEFVEIKPNQTAFVIPLEGKTSDQGKFESEDFLKKAQVATKRIEVPHKWVQTGRWNHQGEWKDTVRVLVVDRYPETREWSGEKTAFVGESKDSIKFIQGMSATAQVQEEDTAKFLYQYSGKNLKDVTDSEIRNKIGSVLLEKYSTMTIEEIRADKGSVIAYVRKEVEPYFKDRGITLSNIGYIGDMKYIDNAIQTAINKKFNAQEEKKAQDITNKMNEEKAQSELIQAQKKAKAMQTLETMKELEIQETIAKGLSEGTLKLPETLVIGEDGNMLFNIPVKDKKEENK
jgi:SPFH domain / Band 7 family